MTKQDSPQVHKDGLTYTNQSMRYTMSTKVKKCMIGSIDAEKALTEFNIRS